MPDICGERDALCSTSSLYRGRAWYRDWPRDESRVDSVDEACSRAIEAYFEKGGSTRLLLASRVNVDGVKETKLIGNPLLYLPAKGRFSFNKNKLKLAFCIPRVFKGYGGEFPVSPILPNCVFLFNLFELLQFLFNFYLFVPQLKMQGNGTY